MEAGVIYFLRACELHSFTKVADEMYISQPTITRRIQNLENEIGVTLLIRTSAGVEITDAGKVFYAESKKMLEAENKLRNKMQRFQKDHCGLLRIGYGRFVSLKPLLHSVHILKSRYPNAELQLQEMEAETLLDNYANGFLDMIYNCRYFFPAALHDTKIGTLERMSPLALVPHNHRLASAESISVADLKGEVLVIQKRWNEIQEIMYNVLENEGVFLGDAIVCITPRDRLLTAALSGHIAIGGENGNENSENYDEFSEFFTLVKIIGTNITGADLCVAYHPSNVFSRLIAEAALEDEALPQ